MLPTAFLITQLPLVTLGISLKVLCRRFTSASLSPSMKRATHLSKAAKAYNNNEDVAGTDDGVFHMMVAWLCAMAEAYSHAEVLGTSRRESMRRDGALFGGIDA